MKIWSEHEQLEWKYCSKLKFATTVWLYAWQNIVKSLHNKLLTTDLFLFRASREKISANELEKEEGLREFLRSYRERSPLKKRYKEKSVCVSGMDTALTLRRKRMGTRGSSWTECAWKVPNWAKFAWLSSPQLWFGKISVDGFQLVVHGAIREKAISWGCKTVHKELPKGPGPLAGHRMKKEGAVGGAKAAECLVSVSRCPGKGWRVPRAATLGAAPLWPGSCLLCQNWEVSGVSALQKTWPREQTACTEVPSAFVHSSCRAMFLFSYGLTD